MTRTSHRRTAALGVAAAALVSAAGGAFAAGSSSAPVTASTTLGTRTLNLYDLSGNALDATGSGIGVGAGKGGAFLVNVTDAGYAHAGYQVKATMTDLYRYTGTSYDFTKSPLASSNVSISYPSSVLDLANVASTVAPVLHLTSNLPVIGGALDTTTTGASQSLTTLAQHVTNGALAALPLKVLSGTAGTFDTPAQLSATGAPTVSGTGTQLSVMTANAQSGDVAGLLAALKALYDGKSAAQLVAAGLVDKSAVLSAVVTATGTPLTIVSANADAILAGITGSVSALSDPTAVLGQTGSYNSLPKLDVAIPSGTASGTYRGELTVTLADLP